MKTKNLEYHAKLDKKKLKINELVDMNKMNANLIQNYKTVIQ